MSSVCVAFLGMYKAVAYEEKMEEIGKQFYIFDIILLVLKIF